MKSFQSKVDHEYYGFEPVKTRHLKTEKHKIRKPNNPLLFILSAFYIISL